MIKACENCGNEFNAVKRIRIFCSNSCSKAYANRDKSKMINCDTCGSEMKRPNCHIFKNNFCSIICRDKFYRTHKTRVGSLSCNWNGGITQHDGYRFKRIGIGIYKQEHRIIMENFIGRKLNSSEIIHHIDGNKLNNDIGNLEIVTRSEHINIHRDGLYTSRRQEAISRGKIKRSVWRVE